MLLQILAIIVQLDVPSALQLHLAISVIRHLYYIKVTVSLSALQDCIVLIEHARAAQPDVKFVPLHQIVVLVLLV